MYISEIVYQYIQVSTHLNMTHFPTQKMRQLLKGNRKLSESVPAVLGAIMIIQIIHVHYPYYPCMECLPTCLFISIVNVGYIYVYIHIYHTLSVCGCNIVKYVYVYPNIRNSMQKWTSSFIFMLRTHNHIYAHANSAHHKGPVDGFRNPAHQF